VHDGKGEDVFCLYLPIFFFSKKEKRRWICFHSITTREESHKKVNVDTFAIT